MLPFSYEDRHPAFSASSIYATTNEEPVVLRRMIRSFKKGLAIASGGEVTFLALLPKCEESLVLVDHAYGSLLMFTIKALLLATLGPDATRALLIDDERKGWKEAIHAITAHIPVSMFKHTPDPALTFMNHSYDMRREWFYADRRSLRKAAVNLHKIKLIHGDLCDTSDRAPYDLLYLSNAMEHSCRPSTGTQLRAAGTVLPDVHALTKLLMRKGSKILWTSPRSSTILYGNNRLAAQAWPIMVKIQGYRSSWQFNLSHYTGILPEAPPAPAPAPPLSVATRRRRVVGKSPVTVTTSPVPIGG